MFIHVEIKKLKSRTRKEILGSRTTYEMILGKRKMFTRGRSFRKLISSKFDISYVTNDDHIST